MPLSRCQDLKTQTQLHKDEHDTTGPWQQQQTHEEKEEGSAEEVLMQESSARYYGQWRWPSKGPSSCVLLTRPATHTPAAKSFAVTVMEMLTPANGSAVAVPWTHPFEPRTWRLTNPNCLPYPCTQVHMQNTKLKVHLNATISYSSYFIHGFEGAEGGLEGEPGEMSRERKRKVTMAVFFSMIITICHTN